MKKIRVMVAEDNTTLLDQMCQIINESNFAEVVYRAENGKEAIEALQAMEIDVLILDLIMPMIDGIGVLECINQEGIVVPEIMVLSAIGHEDIVKRVMALNVHYYMIKPFDLSLIMKRIKSFGSDIDEKRNVTYVNSGKKASHNLDEQITSIFLSIGIPAHIKGYQFLRIAVKKVVEKPNLINSITKRLYPSVADEFETTASKVERAIRHAIDVAWNRGRIEYINELFEYNVYTKNYKPTNGEFIALIADKLIIDRSA
ncbi:MAG: sporulation transcription factor Spo0A [Eubacteriales bacterium]